MQQLPAGITPDMVRQLQAFLSTQDAEMAKATRPRGLLEKHQIRGVNPAYKYQFREYPKALSPPLVEVKNAQEEKTFRRQYNQPLPWAPNVAEQRQFYDAYYAMREYPALMQPSQVTVHSHEEEDQMRAKWRAERGHGTDATIYPRWVFSPIHEPRYVTSDEQERMLIGDWYTTPQEAMTAARGNKAPPPAMMNDRDALIRRAEELGLSIDGRWGIERLRKAVSDAEESVQEEAATA